MKKTKLPSHLKANALQYTLIIGVVIFILVLSIILYFHFNTLVGYTTDLKVKQIRKNQDTFLQEPSFAYEGLAIKNWGAFQITTSSKEGDVEQWGPLTLAGMTAQKWHQGKLPQLHLENNPGSLQISGSTRMEGVLHVPNEIIKTSNVAGRIYEGRASGNILLRSSQDRLPKYRGGLSTFQEAMDSTKDSILTELPTQLTHSFLKKTVVYRDAEEIILTDNKLTGNIKIISDRRITVSHSAQLKDVLLIAPTIEIAPRSVMQAHLVGTDSLILNKNAHLQFPSSMTTLVKEENQGRILLKEKSRVDGLINQFSLPKPKVYVPNLEISDGAIVNGLIYNLGITQLKGTVNGSIFTHKFVALEKGSVYINLILDGEIRNPEWTSKLLDLFDLKSPKNQPIQWLY
ncbi:hypothetical protein [Nonlabens xiamenensis]|uniref:hypothetical protein n=1 Tax=Nonlabens xiamenensis TaxID=2341043 RepID=UPI000F60C9DF|nr:hypothetical protein [Nonlabens xiamenensis]